MDNELNIDDLIGVRFTNHGRNVTEGFDCYGLAIEVSRRLGHKLEDLWYEKSNPQTFCNNYKNVKDRLCESVEETNELSLGNLIVFSDSKGNMIHIGVLLNEDSFIHADTGGVKIIRLSSYYRKTWKVYKWLQ